MGNIWNECFERGIYKCFWSFFANPSFNMFKECLENVIKKWIVGKRVSVEFTCSSSTSSTLVVSLLWGKLTWKPL